jgi:Restriction endonuclease
MSAVIEDLHEAVFGFRPPKAGAAYERLAAVVLATLGWTEVVHDTVEHPRGKRARHELDVTARHPDGHVRRIIIECKDWETTVGKGTLDALVGVRSQVGADAAAALTTCGFTKGARAVATDEEVALVVLRRFNPAAPDLYVESIRIGLDFYAPIRSDVGVEVLADSMTPLGMRLRGTDRLLLLDSSPAETIHEVLMAHLSPMKEGVYHQRAEFPDGRLLPTVDGSRIAIGALHWTETMRKSSMTHTLKAVGTPELVLEQLDQDGAVDHGQMIVDRDLYAWDIDLAGHVVRRGGVGD